MARLTDKYDEIFKYVGEKFGLTKLTYETYRKLPKGDTRRKNFDAFIEDNLPIEKSKDEEFKTKIKELNDTYLMKKDWIQDSKSFFKLGGELHPEETKTETSERPVPVSGSSKKEPESRTYKRDNISGWKKIKRFFGDMPEDFITASAWSSAAFLLTRFLGWNANWPFITMVWTANITLAIPAVFAAYCSYKLVEIGIKNGTFKRWGQAIKSKIFTKRNIKEIEKEPLPKVVDISKELDKIEEQINEIAKTELSDDDIENIAIFTEAKKNLEILKIKLKGFSDSIDDKNREKYKALNQRIEYSLKRFKNELDKLYEKTCQVEPSSKVETSETISLELHAIDREIDRIVNIISSDSDKYNIEDILKQLDSIEEGLKNISGIDDDTRKYFITKIETSRNILKPKMAMEKSGNDISSNEINKTILQIQETFNSIMNNPIEDVKGYIKSLEQIVDTITKLLDSGVFEYGDDKRKLLRDIRYDATDEIKRIKAALFEKIKRLEARKEASEDKIANIDRFNAMVDEFIRMSYVEREKCKKCYIRISDEQFDEMPEEERGKLKFIYDRQRDDWRDIEIPIDELIEDIKKLTEPESTKSK